MNEPSKRYSKLSSLICILKFYLHFKRLLAQASVAYEQAHLWVRSASGQEQSDPAGRSLVKRRQESSLSRLAASPLDFAHAATPRTLVLQREPACRLKPQLQAIVVPVQYGTWLRSITFYCDKTFTCCNCQQPVHFLEFPPNSSIQSSERYCHQIHLSS